MDPGFRRDDDAGAACALSRRKEARDALEQPALLRLRRDRHCGHVLRRLRAWRAFGARRTIGAWRAFGPRRTIRARRAIRTRAAIGRALGGLRVRVIRIRRRARAFAVAAIATATAA